MDTGKKFIRLFVGKCRAEKKRMYLTRDKISCNLGMRDMLHDELQKGKGYRKDTR